MPISVKLQAFEGPLDLLLHLIAKNKLDIKDIEISVLVDQYIAQIEQFKEYLKDKYYIFFEIGYNQGERLKELALKYLDCNVEVKKDLQGFDRYVIIKSK